MKLFGARLSPFYERIRLQMVVKNKLDKIEEAGVPGGDLKSAEYLAIHPLGKIPCLQDGNFLLPESSAIAEYLEEVFPSPSLFPDSAEGRAQVRMIVKYLDVNVMVHMTTIFRQLREKEKDKAIINQALESTVKSLDALEVFIHPTPFLVGDKWTLADCSLLPIMFFMTRIMPMFGVFPLEGRPKLERWHLAIQDKPIAAESEAAMQKAFTAFTASKTVS